jgi:lipopolysaccharide biosynthesis protein
MLEWDNCPRTRPCYSFDYYSPEQFYMINKIIIEWTKKNYNETNQFIFINSWNEWGEGSYLEPDEKYGYASINSLSKALFNLPYIEVYDIKELNKESKIAIQIHLYYKDLLEEVINKINNIPYKYDLFISICSRVIKKEVKNYVKEILMLIILK